MNKKIFLAVLFSTIFLATSAFAKGNNGKEITIEYIPLSQGFCHEALIDNSVTLMTDESDNSDGIKKLLEGIEACSETIYFDDDDFVFAIDESNYDEKGDFIVPQFAVEYSGIIDMHPEFFYVRNGFGGSIDIYDDTYCIKSVTPVYIMSKSEVAKAKPEFDKLTAEIAEYVGENGETELEKAILLHDYIVLNFGYDRTYTIYDAYNFLKEGRGVCESYSKLYRYVLGLCGIEAKYASSDALNHLWNIVKIDGKWYHVDVTWDDPSPNMPGYITHDNFLIGDKDFQDTEIYDDDIHYGFVTEDGIVCKETYKDAFWGHMAEENSAGFIYADSPIVFDSQNYYYTAYNYDTHTSSVVARSKESANEKNVVSFKDTWKVPGENSYYPGNFSGLSLIDGVLIYNTPTEIRYVLPSGKHDTLIKEIQYKDSHYGDASAGYIYRFATSLDGKFYKNEPYYTHIDPKNIDGVKVGNGIGKGSYKDGKDMYHVEIDYFIATDPVYGNGTERDIDIHVSFDDIHNVKEKVIKKQTYITKGKKEKTCKECDSVETVVTQPICNEGDNAHEPTIDDIKNVIKAIIGTGPLSGTDVGNDVDGDNTLSLHDINELFGLLRDQLKENT